VTAPFTRSFVWHGITYDIAGRDHIRMRSYVPYRAPCRDVEIIASRSII
jgi:hypothetical protein